MHGWLGVVEGVALLILLVVLSLVMLAVRRRWLNRLGGTFDCSLRLNVTTPGAGWTLGVGRYNEGILEWFRFFSYALRPRKVFQRGEVRVLATRDPDPVEAVALNADNRILRVEMLDSDTDREWELAMSPESLTGLLSWLEAAPPGVRRGRVGLALPVQSLVANAASNEAAEGLIAFIRRMKSRPSGAPSRRSIPASSHSMEMAPS